MDNSINKLGEMNKKATQPAPKTPQSTLQIFQSQTPELVSASDEKVKTFRKKNDSKKFFRAIRDLEGDFPWNGYDTIPLGGNAVRTNDGDYDLNYRDSDCFP